MYKSKIPLQELFPKIRIQSVIWKIPIFKMYLMATSYKLIFLWQDVRIPEILQKVSFLLIINHHI
jgi:hypothetical protein